MFGACGERNERNERNGRTMRSERSGGALRGGRAGGAEREAGRGALLAALALGLGGTAVGEPAPGSSTSPAAASVTRSAQDDVADVPAQDLRAGDDEHKRYFLIGPAEGAKPPRAGYKLVLVLPGGDGSADFHPFVKRIWKNALDGEEVVVAQLVAPKWSADQFERVVWPTEKNPWPKMEFSTEELVAAVIADVEKRLAIDPDFVFTFSWSSGGPAAYAASLADDSRITGTFVAMSVFKPGQLPSLKAAKGQAYYLLQSPDDTVTRLSWAEDAVEKLGKKGAEVELATYPGGHGWRGDVYGNLRAGFRWLEKHHAKPRKR